ncbi:MAG: ABC transporter transmembrane domain-containing protein [Desulfovibrio sp.]
MKLTRFKKDTGLFSDIASLPSVGISFFDLFASSLGINILSLSLPLLLMQVYDRIIPTQSSGTLLWLTFGFSIALIFDSILRYCRSTITNWLAAKFEHQLSNECISHWLNSRIDDFEKDGAGAHLDQLAAISKLRSFYSGQGFQMLLDLPFAILFVGIVWYIGGEYMAAYPVVLICIFLFIVYLIRRNYHQKRQQQKVLNDRRYNFLVEALDGIHAIKSLTIEEQMLRRYERLLADTAKADFSVSVTGDTIQSVGNTFAQLILFGILLIGGTLAIQGQLTIGSIAACTLLSNRLFQPFKNLATFWIRYADWQIAKKRLQEVASTRIDRPEDAPQLPVEIERSVRVEKLAYRPNANQPHLFQDLNLSIGSGELVCISGVSTRESTALTQILAGIIAPESGSVSVGDLDIFKHSRDDLKGRIEYLPHNGVLFQGSIFDNITLFDSAHHDAARDAADLLGLDEHISSLPHGYETRVGGRLFEFLSSGLVQRICLARALTVRPRVLVLDRFNDSLDSESEQLFRWVLKKLKGNCTIIISTDNPAVCNLSDRVLFFEDGALKESNIYQCVGNAEAATNRNVFEGDEDAWKRWILHSARTWDDVAGVVSCIGNKDIDKDHEIFTKYVLELGGVIKSFTDRKASFETLEAGNTIFLNLMDYAQFHFAREEKIMQETNNPHYERHVELHHYFLNMISNYHDDFLEGRISKAASLMQELLDWWVNHINHIDYMTFSSSGECAL